MKIIQRAIYAIRSYCLRTKFKSCHKTVRFEHLGKLGGGKFISIGAYSDVQQFTYLTAWPGHNANGRKPEIIIGNDCHIGAFNHITCIDSIIIGDGFVSGKWVTITDNGHGGTSKEDMMLPVSKRPIVSKGPIRIGKNVWVGDKATILAGVTIGDGSIIAANSVITKDVPPYSVVAGSPAKIIKFQP